MRAVVPLVAVLLLCSPAVAVDLPPLSVDPGGAVEGGDALYMPHGDILNVRNIQGGTVDEPNLDVGAGDGSYHRGVLSLNYDVGSKVAIYDGHKRLLATFSRRGIVFYVRPHYAKKP